MLYLSAMNTLNYHFLKKVTYVYMSLPLLIFFAYWLGSVLAIVYIAMLSYVLFNTCKYTGTSHQMSPLILQNPKTFYSLCIGVAVLWCTWSGLGGYFFQTYDHDGRNPILRDLIFQAWPVTYSNHTVLSYYFGFWLPPALLTKLFAPVLSPEITFLLGQHLLLLYSIIGITLLFLLIIYSQRATGKLAILLCLLFPVFFSGMDIIGALLLHEEITVDSSHIEWWTSFQYSSLTSCLFWVYNQTIISWLAVMIFWIERKIQDFGILFVLCFFCGPLPSVGLALFMAGWILYHGLSLRTKQEMLILLQQIFSLNNIFTVLFFVPLLLAFFKTNGAAGLHPFAFELVSFNEWSLFVLIEFGVIALLIGHKYYKNALFLTMLTSLSVLMFFSIGGGDDFPMRASIPAIIILMLFTLNYILTYSLENLRGRLLFICLVFGTVTPLVEMSRGIKNILNTGNIRHMHDYIKTFEGKDPHAYPYYNYITDQENAFFFRYLSKLPPQGRYDVQ